MAETYTVSMVGCERVWVGFPVAVRGVAPATKEAGGRLRHEDGDVGGAGCQGQKERKKQSGGFFFVLFLGEGKQFGELLF
jgi:hypothetical protein